MPGLILITSDKFGG